MFMNQAINGCLLLWYMGYSAGQVEKLPGTQQLPGRPMALPNHIG
jgi:hypothetical protein